MSEFTTADPVAIAQSMLDHALEVIDDPPVVYVSHGEPAAPAPTEGCDNEQLTAHVVRMRPKVISDTSAIASRIAAVSWVVSMAVVLWRCVPLAEEQGDIAPDTSALDAAYKALLTEGIDIARHYSRLVYKDAWPELAPCRDVIWGNLDPIAPSGGIAGWRLNVDVQL